MIRRRSWIRDAVAVFLLCLVTALVCAPLHGCGATPRKVASVSVVSLGTVLAAVHQEHQRSFERASDALVARLAADGGRPADYDREAAPLVATFRARGEGLYSLSALLYTAAQIIDDSRASGALPPAWLPAAARLSEAVDRILRVLADGSILPAVPIPPSVLQITGALRAIASPLIPASRLTDGGLE